MGGHSRRKQTGEKQLQMDREQEQQWFDSAANVGKLGKKLLAEIHEEIMAKHGSSEDTLTWHQARWDTRLILWNRQQRNGDWTEGMSPSEPSTMAKPIARELGLWKEPEQRSSLQTTSSPSFNKPAIYPQHHSTFQVFSVPSIRTPTVQPEHYNQSLDQAAKDFEKLLLARNAPRIPQFLNPHAPEFRGLESNLPRIPLPTLNPHALEFQGSSSSVQSSNNTAGHEKDLEARLRQLEDEVSQLKTVFQEHLAKCPGINGGLEQGGMGQETVKVEPTDDGTLKNEPVRGGYGDWEEYDGGDLMSVD